MNVPSMPRAMSFSRYMSADQLLELGQGDVGRGFVVRHGRPIIVHRDMEGHAPSWPPGLSVVSRPRRSVALHLPSTAEGTERLLSHRPPARLQISRGQAQPETGVVGGQLDRRFELLDRLSVIMAPQQRSANTRWKPASLTSISRHSLAQRHAAG